MGAPSSCSNGCTFNVHFIMRNVRLLPLAMGGYAGRPITRYDERLTLASSIRVPENIVHEGVRFK
jgi:hypothetical protein